MKKIVIVGLCLVLVVTFSGCIGPGGNWGWGESGVISIGTHIDVESSVVENLSQIQIEKIQALNYSYINASGRGESRIQHWFFRPSGYNDMHNEIEVAFILDIYNKSYIHVSHNPTLNFKKSEIESREEYAKNETNRVMAICNITLNWSKVQWTVTYAD